MFFEECIKEEQYEAQKLDIMRDALRAKATYTIETKKMTGDSDGASGSESLPTSPRELSPIPTEETNGKMENGSTSAGVPSGNHTNVANGNGAVANGNGADAHADSTS